MYDNIISESQIFELLSHAQKPDNKQIDDILTKAKELKGLSKEDVAVLLNIEDDDTLQKLYETALYIKEEIYGNRLVLFAPLYVSNHCANNCLYCGFRAANKEIHRHTLTLDQVKEETLELLKQGHKRALMLMVKDTKAVRLTTS
jgi:2-iminoacetate synthase